MKRIMLALALAMVFALIGTAFVAAQMMDMPKAEGAALWEFISKTDDYTKWEMWPGKEGIYPGKSPHGMFLKLFVNKPAMEAIKAGKPFPDGAILVKENYGEDKTSLMAITPMYRMKDYNAEGGDWFWAKYGTKGEVQAEGKIEGCIKCHAQVKDKDWVFSGK